MYNHGYDVSIYFSRCVYSFSWVRAAQLLPVDQIPTRVRSRANGLMVLIAVLRHEREGGT